MRERQAEEGTRLAPLGHMATLQAGARQKKKMKKTFIYSTVEEFAKKRTRKPRRSKVGRVLCRGDVDVLEYMLSYVKRKLPFPARRTELSALHQRPACYK